MALPDLPPIRVFSGFPAPDSRFSQLVWHYSEKKVSSFGHILVLLGSEARSAQKSAFDPN
jgi:hypothetical protein